MILKFLKKRKFKHEIQDIKQEIQYIRQDVINNYYLNLEIFKNQIYLLKDLNIFKEFTSNIKFYSESDCAYNSNDCKYPEATLDGLIRKPLFTNKIKSIFKENASLLDIGCGAGGIVFDALMQGIPGFGIDGSDYNKKTGYMYWSILKNNLLTCDATKKYYFKKNEEFFKFKVISSWECLEHIPENNIPDFLFNIYQNLDDDGYFVGSISKLPYEKDGIVYHVTLKDNTWWEDKFRQCNFKMLHIEDSPFEFEEFCRGTGRGWQDLHTNYVRNPENGILFVARKSI